MTESQSYDTIDGMAMDFRSNRLDIKGWTWLDYYDVVSIAQMCYSICQIG